MTQLTKIVFFGTPEFAVPTLNALREVGYDIVAVVTQPDKPAGRGMLPTPSPIKKLAMELSIPVLQPATLKSAHTLRTLQSFNAAVAVCVAYGKIIPREVIDIFPKGILNIHPSLLPKYRGPSPIQSAILSGDPETGVTLMLLDAEMDHGPILTQHVVPLAPSPSLRYPSPSGRGQGEGQTGSELSKILSREGAKLLVENLPKYLAGEIKPPAQNHDEATFTKMLEREDGKIDWQKPADYIERMVRAYDLWPGTWTTWQGKPVQISPREKFQSGKRLKVLKVSLLHSTIGCASNATPGYVWKAEDGRLAVNCHPGSIILEQLQLEGKKAMSGPEFLRGYPKLLGTAL